jgi:hypothetical protein
VTIKEVTHHIQVEQFVEGYVFQLKWPLLLFHLHKFNTKLTFGDFLINSIEKKPTIRRMYISLPFSYNNNKK